jgi:hypothetical protein
MVVRIYAIAFIAFASLLLAGSGIALAGGDYSSPQSEDSYSTPDAEEQPAAPEDAAPSPPEDDSGAAAPDDGGGDDASAPPAPAEQE